MIHNDEKKPINLMELISDEPRDVEPYIEYLISDLKAYRDASWSKPEPIGDGQPTTQECVRYQIDSQVMRLENILRKLRRERKEESR